MSQLTADIDALPVPKGTTLLLWLQLPLLLVVLYVGYQWMLNWLDQPLQDVDVQGRLVNTEAKDLRLLVWKSAGGSYMDLDLMQIKSALEANPWVHRVDVRRQWPASLSIDVLEEKPVARWGEQSLLNSDAAVFTPKKINGFDQLPKLTGPESRSLEMMSQYRSMSELVRPLGLRINEMLLEPRGAWTLEFDNGVALLLGRGRLIEKLQRFARIYAAQLMPHQDKIKRVDVRYTNGLSVTWRAGVMPTATPETGKKRG